jgi:hypothetical protein
MKHYFDESFRQLNTAIAMPISTVIGPMTDQVVVLLIGLPPSTPNPCNAQIRPNIATSTPNARVTTKALLIRRCYVPDRGCRALTRQTARAMADSKDFIAPLIRTGPSTSTDTG